jgi:hypothetical protein
MFGREFLFHDCPNCKHDDHNMYCIEDQGIVDTREGDSFGAIYHCDTCDTVWNITTGVREREESLYDDEREQYLAMMREQQLEA